MGGDELKERLDKLDMKTASSMWKKVCVRAHVRACVLDILVP